MCAKHGHLPAAILLIALFAVGCFKNQLAQSPRKIDRQNSTPGAPSIAPSTMKDLGVIELTNHWETEISLGSNRICRIRPKILDKKNLQITIALETKGADGKTEGLNATRAVTHPGQYVDISVGDMDIAFTPNVKSD